MSGNVGATEDTMPIGKSLLALLLVVVALAAVAEGRTYAVMSLVGDGLLVVHHRASTGSSIDRDTRQFIALADPVLDRTALLAVDEALRRSDPAAKPVLLAARDAGLLEAQAKALASGAGVQAIADALRPRLPPNVATHLVLVAKHRAPAAIKLAEGSVGSGHLEGLGFYVDRGMRVRIPNTNRWGQGFLGPFAYFTVALVDLRSGKVIAEQPVRASIARSQARSDTLDPWDALSAEEKVKILEALIREETARAMPTLVKSGGP